MTASAPDTPRKFTVDDHRVLPDGLPCIQLVGGRFHASAPPSASHQRIAVELCLILGNWARRSRAGQVCLAPFNIYLSQNDVVQSDLLFVSTDRLSLIREDGIHGAPDLAVEILSPATASLDKGGKYVLYARSGVREMWLVDPLLRSVIIHRFSGGHPESIHCHGVLNTIVSPVLPGLEIEVAGIFPPREESLSWFGQAPGRYLD